ncbi:ferredoxin [Mycolicibacterium celeriflavum]|uniref:Ferredoxin n=1 Tax=Mycolicibacterium celeriflavum TaxID=1249101 RepID=A0A7I7RPW1_MYCCF|nr:ferredoxin [Mycolicibacterium celeriflavum]BBY46567.1 ferredoxin [Mycolicibacterium celeriflavum]
MKVSVDGTRCQGHTLCAMISPDSFELDDVDGHASPVNEVVPADQEDLVRAAQSCPEQAIVIE